MIRFLRHSIQLIRHHLEKTFFHLFVFGYDNVYRTERHNIEYFNRQAHII